jgi:hypothetical protein
MSIFEQKAGREPQPTLRKEELRSTLPKLPDLMKRPQYLANTLRHLQPSLSTHRCCTPPPANAIRFVLY